MPYIKQWVEPNALLHLDEETRQELELDWFLTRQELAQVVNRYLQTRDFQNPSGMLTFDELTPNEQEEMAVAAAGILQSQLQAVESPLTMAWDQIDLTAE